MEIGLFGASHPHAELHIKTLAASDRVRGIAVYDDEPEVTKQLGGVIDTAIRVWDSVDGLLANTPLSAAIVCMRNDRNASLCRELLAQGVPVLSEKPVGISSSEIRAVVDCAREKGFPLGVFYPNRFHPAAQKARELISEGILGSITSCEGRLMTSQIRFRDPAHWIFSKAKSGGGILSWLGCHFLDLFEYISGLHMESVSGCVGTLGGDAVDVENVGVVLMQFTEGAMGSFQAGYQLPHSPEGLIYPRYDTYLTFRGTLGRAWWDPTGSPAELHVESRHPAWKNKPERVFAFQLPELDVYGGAHGLAFLNQFLDAVQGTADVPASGEDALRVSRIIEAVYHSSAHGKRVPLAAHLESEG